MGGGEGCMRVCTHSGPPAVKRGKKNLFPFQMGVLEG